MTSEAQTPLPPLNDPASTPTLGALLRGRRHALGWTLDTLSKKAGCARSYISMLETGQRGERGTVDGELLTRLEGALGLEAGSLDRAARWSATPASVRREVRGMEAGQHAAAAQLRALLNEGSLDETFKRGRLRALVAKLEGVGGGGSNVQRGAAPGGRLPVQVPLVNSVAAGYPREFTDLGYPARVADEYILSPDLQDPDAFAARVVGDSMSPEYREGDVVVFAPRRAVRTGMDCFVRLERDNETTFKRVELFAEMRQEMIRLVALNPSYPSRVIEREQVAFMCPAVSVTRRLGA